MCTWSDKSYLVSPGRQWSLLAFLLPFFVLFQVYGVGTGFKWHHSGNARDRDNARPVSPAGGAECCAVSAWAAGTWQHRYPSLVKAALMGEAFYRLFCNPSYPPFPDSCRCFSRLPTTQNLCVGFSFLFPSESPLCSSNIDSDFFSVLLFFFLVLWPFHLVLSGSVRVWADEQQRSEDLGLAVIISDSANFVWSSPSENETVLPLLAESWAVRLSAVCHALAHYMLHLIL